MAPIKFEDQIKEKLEHRKLQPRAEAWLKLSDQLDENTPNRTNKGAWWLGIAASFIGVLLVVNFLFNSEKENNTIPIIVDTEDVNGVETNTKIPNSNEDAIIINKEHQNVATDNHNSQKNLQEQITNKESTSKQLVNNNKEDLIPIKIEGAVVLSEIDKNKSIRQKDNAVKVLTFDEQMVQKVAAKMQELQINSKTDSEIDDLLNAAQQEIALEKLYKEAIKTVDADALLEDVEVDLDQSFRARVFEAIQSNYQSVKTAIAERNN